MQPSQMSLNMNMGREERGRSKSEAASERASSRKHNFMRLLNKKRSKDTPLRPKPKLRFPKLTSKEGAAFGDPSDCYPPLGRLEPSLTTGSKEWSVYYLGSIPNCPEWRSYRTRSEFLEHVDWGKRHGYLMCRSTSQKTLMLSGTWLQITDRRKKLLYVLNGIAQISSISCCEDSVEEDELLLGIKCLHPLGSMVQCHVLIVESRKCMSEICEELQFCFESLTRDREKIATQVQNVSESLARLQHHQGSKALTVRQTAQGAMEGIEMESRHAVSEQPLFRSDTLGQKGHSIQNSVASSSEVGSLQPPVPIRRFEIHQLEESEQPTGTQVPKRLQSLILPDTTQTKEILSPVNNHSPEGSDSDHSPLDPPPPSPPLQFTDSVLPDKPVARRIKKIINRLDLPEEHPSPQVSRLPPPPKKIWQDGEDDELPPVIRRPRRRQLDDPIDETPVPISPPVQQAITPSEPLNVQKAAPVPSQNHVTQSHALADTEKELLDQQMELDIALRELQALNLGIDLPITHVDDVTVPIEESNPITSLSKIQPKHDKEFTGLRTLIPPPPADIPLELRETREASCSSSGDENYQDAEIEIPQQMSALELRKRFDPEPDKKQALFFEIRKGLNLRKVSGDHPVQRPKQDTGDFRSVLTEIKQGGSKQRLRKVSQASQNRLAQSQKGRTVGELGAKLAERRLATEPPEQKPVDPAVLRAQKERYASRFARTQTGINPQTDLDADPIEYLPPWKRQLLESREEKRLAVVRDKEEKERLKEEQMKDVPMWKRKLIEKRVVLKEQDDKKEAQETARLQARIRKFENMPEWKKEVLRKQGKVDVIETSDSDTESD